MAAREKVITIVGGGLAGLTLGISLRQQQVPVLIHEASHYPRHRVCGEFISGGGLKVLEGLGLRDVLTAAGARPATRVQFHTANRASSVYELPERAWCLSRYRLDACLAEHFRSSGGDLKENSRWPQTVCDPGVVRATGRRAQPTSNGWRWFGLKVHVHGPRLGADLEMHGVANGYVGLCQLSGDLVNVCGLFWSRQPEPQLGERWRDWLLGRPGSQLHERLAGAEFDLDSFSTIAGLPLRPRRAQDLPEICVGDSLTMIPPVTGNGMFMAFESAALATDALVRYSRGDADWEQARQQIAKKCDSSFGGRLRVAWTLQRCLLLPGWGTVLATAVTRSGFLWRRLFQLTR